MLAERLEGRARDFETLAADIPKRWTNQHLRDGVAYNLTVYAKVSRDDAATVRALAASQETPQESMRKALEPFASVGAWLFARPEVSDDEVLVELCGINGARGGLTRGDFKAAYLALELPPECFPLHLAEGPDTP